MHKIIFKNSEAGIPEDWTQYLSDMSSISRRVESENAGEAGVIVYDNVSLEFEYKDSSPIFNAFNGDLSSIQRYIIEVYGIKTTGVEVKMFEGIVDFSSLEWPDLSKKISFDVLDKLSALDIIASELPRTENTLNLRILAQLPNANSLRCMFLPAPYEFPSDCTELIIYAKDSSSNTLDFTEEIILPGEYLQDPQTWGAEPKYYLVKESYLGLDDNNNMVNWVVLVYPLIAEIDYAPKGSTYYLSNNAYYLSKEFYGLDINILNENSLQSLDALKIIEAIFRKAWSSDPIINKCGESIYAIPIEYGKKLIDENPFGKHPLDALKMLADSMQCYIFTNRSGELVIQKKSALAINGTTRSFNDLKKNDGSKKYFWDKLADEIEITVNSWVIDEDSGNYLQGTSSLKKNPNIKARNSISKEVLAIDSNVNTQELLNSNAALTANEYFNFYGNRHFAYPIGLNLYDDILDWELLDNLTVDAEQYFFETLEIDLLGMLVDLELVSVASYNYDSKQAHVIVGEGNESSYSSSGSSSSTSESSTTVVLNKKLVALSELDNNPGLVVQVSDYGFSKRSVVGMANQVSVANGDGVSGDITISLPQNIHTAAVPTFAGTKLTTLTPNRIISADADNNLVSTNASSWIAGTNNQITVADDGDGSVTISLPQDIHTAATPTFAGAILNGNVSVDGNLSVSSLTQNRLVFANASNNLVSTNVSAWIDGTNNQVSVADDGDGTVTLSLPQDIHTAATPQFAQIGLGGVSLSGYAASIYSDAIGTNNFVSETTGWNIDYSGNADLRKIYADEMRVKAFTADIEQALAGSDILAKSVAILFEDFVIPGVGLTGTLKVEDLPGFNNLANFVSGDWIRLRIFDRSGGGLTVGDVWGTVSGYVSYQNDTQTWVFTTQQVSFANLVGKKVYKGSIVLDYGTSGQGVIERTVLGDYAPYSQMSTWTSNPYTAGNYSIGLRTGNLIGITDSDFGGSLSGYGMYATNVYLKGKLYAIAGSNVAGWQTTASQFKSPTLEIGASGVFATSYLDANVGSNKIGLHIGLDNTSNSNDEWISVGSILDKDGVVEADKFGIAYKSYLGNYFELTNSAKNIAGWSFDYEKFTKGNARLEASATFSGLAITDGSVDTVMVGDFAYTMSNTMSNITTTVLWEATPSAGGIGADKWEHYGGYWDSGNTWHDNTSTLTIYERVATQDIFYVLNPTNFVLNEGYVGKMFHNFRDLSYIKGRRIKVSFYLETVDSEQGDNACTLTVSAFFPVTGSCTQCGIDKVIYTEEIPGGALRVIDKTAGIEIDVPYNIDWTTWTGDIRLEFRLERTAVTEVSPTILYATDIKVEGFTRVKTFINDEGLNIYNSPTFNFSFMRDGFVINAPSINIDGKSGLRYFGENSGKPNATEVMAGDIYKDTSDGAFYIASKDVNTANEPLVYKISGSVASNDDPVDWEAHVASTNNPHSVSKEQIVGLRTSNSPQFTAGYFTGDLTVDGDLFIGGVVNQVNVTDLYVSDHKIILNRGGTDASANSGGIIIEGTGASTLGSILWTSDKWTFAEQIVAPSFSGSLAWSNLTSVPTTVLGFGITDAVQEGDSVTLTGDVSGTANFNSDGNVSITVTVANDSHTHDGRYFTEAEITTNYYDKTYIDSNYTTSTNQYGKWVVSDGTNTYNVVKDAVIPFTGTGGISTLLTANSMVFSIATNTFANYVHNHDDRYFTETEITTNYYDKTGLDAGQLDNRYYTETEITTNYYDKTYIDSNFTTTTNLYSKWILTDGVTSNNVVKDQTVTFSGANGITFSLLNFTMTVGITANTYANYVHTHDDRYFTETEITTNYYDKTTLNNGQLDTRYYTETELNSGQLDNRYYTETEIGTLFYSKAQLDAGQLDNRYYTETEIDANYLTSTAVANLYYSKTQLDGGQLDNRYYTETESDTLFISSAGGTFTGDVTVGTGADIVDRFLTVTTGDGYIASLNAVGNSLGNGQLLVGRSIDYGGGIFVKGNVGITEPFTLNAVSFYRKNYTSLAEVFYYNVASEGVYFQEEIFAKGITASQRIASTVTTGTSPFTVASATLVNNLNADLWDGYHFLDYLNQGVRTTDNVTHASATLSGNLTFPTGENHFIQIGSDYSWWYKLASLNNDFRILDANEDIDFLRTKYNAGASTRSIELMNGSFILTALGVATFNNSVKSASVEPTNLTTNYFPYKSAASLVDSIISTDGIKIDVAGNISQSGNYSFYNNYISGILGTGFNLGQTVAGSNLEVDNITVRNSLRTHIFQKDVVKAISGIVSISESGVITYASVSTIKFLDSKSSSFVIDDVLWFKDVKDDGTILSVKFTITSVGSSVSGETDYTVNVTEGVLSTDMIGGTASRTSGSIIVLDASSANSPYIDIVRDSIVVSRMGNLAGIVSDSFGQLADDGIWTNRLFAEGDVKIKGHLEATSGTIGGFTTDATKIFSGTDIVIDAFDKRILLANGAMGFGYDIGGANKHGLHIDANNYWYSDKNFSLGGANGISFDGTVILMGSDTKFLGNLSGNTITGTDLVVDATGAIRSSDYVEKEEGWRLSQDGFENNKMRLFELAEDMTAGTPIKLNYDEVSTKASKLVLSNLNYLQENEIYDESYSYDETVSFIGTYNFSLDTCIPINENQFLSTNFFVSYNSVGNVGLLVFTLDEDGNITSATETLIPLPIENYSGTDYVLGTASNKVTKLTDSTLLIHFSKDFYISPDYHYMNIFKRVSISDTGVVTVIETTPVFHEYADSNYWLLVGYMLIYGTFPEESFDATHAILTSNNDTVSIKIVPGGTWVLSAIGSGTFNGVESGFRTSDGKYVLMSRVSKKIRVYTLTSEVFSFIEVAYTRTDFVYASKAVRLREDLFVFSFKRSSDNLSGIYVVSYGAGTVLQGNNLTPDLYNTSLKPSVISDSVCYLRNYLFRVIGSTPFYMFKLKSFSYLDFISRVGSAGNIANFELITSTRLIGNAPLVKNIIDSSGTYTYPTFIKNPNNRPLRFLEGNDGTASDFIRLNTEKYALVRKRDDDYLLFTVIERLSDTYDYYSNDLTIATSGVSTSSSIKKVSDTHFLVKNGYYIYLIKLVGTVLTLVDSNYDTSISSYNQGFAELIEGSRYVHMGSSKALILDIDGDNLTVSSYATTTTTLIANIVGTSDSMWIGAYPFNSGGYKATYRMYTFTGTAVTYTDLVNTTLVSGTDNIIIDHIRDNVILSLLKLDSGNGLISLEELYTTVAATQDSREYPASLFPEISKMSPIGNDVFGAILGDNIVHITISSGKINTRFAENVVGSGNTVDTKCITSASSGNMLLYCKGDYIEEDLVNGGQDAIVIDVINDTYFIDGILEQTGIAGEMKKVALPGDETRAFTNLVPGTRYGVSATVVDTITEEYSKEVILAVETGIAKIL